MPSIVSGKSYQEYLENKLQKKEEMDKAKMERAAERERKKKEEELKTKAKKPRKTLDPISCLILNLLKKKKRARRAICYQPAKKEVGEFLAFKYEGKVFAGKVVQLDEHGPVISAMKPSGKLWKWPVPSDILNYSWADVIGRVKMPVQVSKTREIYAISELEQYYD